MDYFFIDNVIKHNYLKILILLLLFIGQQLYACSIKLLNPAQNQ